MCFFLISPKNPQGSAAVVMQADSVRPGGQVEIDRKLLSSIVRERPRDAHKGVFGHLLVVCGSYLMPGAALLALGGALRSGCGLVTLHSVRSLHDPMAVRYPSAMFSRAPGRTVGRLPRDCSRFSAFVCGCGIRQTRRSYRTVRRIIAAAALSGRPLVLDADALNLMASHRHLLSALGPGAVLTPHPGELRRLVGEWTSPEDKAARTRALSAATGAVVVSKGYRTEIYSPDGSVYVCGAGDSSLAKGGSGDVLSGLLGGLLASGYAPLEAAVLAVWVHGRTGELLRDRMGAVGFTTADLADFLYLGFLDIENND